MPLLLLIAVFIIVPLAELYVILQVGEVGAHHHERLAGAGVHLERHLVTGRQRGHGRPAVHPGLFADHAVVDHGVGDGDVRPDDRIPYHTCFNGASFFDRHVRADHRIDQDNIIADEAGWQNEAVGVLHASAHK